MKNKNKNYDKELNSINNAFNSDKSSVINWDRVNNLSDKEMDMILDMFKK
jgi:hypothetical protein